MRVAYDYLVPVSLERRLCLKRRRPQDRPIEIQVRIPQIGDGTRHFAGSFRGFDGLRRAIGHMDILLQSEWHWLGAKTRSRPALPHIFMQLVKLRRSCGARGNERDGVVNSKPAQYPRIRARREQGW